LYQLREQHHFPGRRQEGRIALEVPGGAVPVRRLAQRHNLGLAWAQVLNDALDRSILPTGVPAFESHEHLVSVLDQVALDLDQLDLQLAERGLVACPVAPVMMLVCVVRHGFSRRDCTNRG
jgi:hypothetical protein